MDISIRHAEPGDFTALQAIYSRPKVIAGTLQVPFPSAETWRKRLAEPPPDTVTLVAEADGRLVGHLGIFLAFRPRRGHAAGICIAVHDDFAGRGIGTALRDGLLVDAYAMARLKQRELEEKQC